MSEPDFSRPFPKSDRDADVQQFDFSLRINQLRQHLLMSHDALMRQEALGEMRPLVTKLIQSGGTSNGLKLYAKAVLLEAEGHELILNFSHRADQTAIRRDLDKPDSVSHLIQDYLDTYAGWERAILDLQRDAVALGDRLILVDALLIRLAVSLYSLLLRDRLAGLLGFSVGAREDHIEPQINDLYAAIDAAVTSGSQETELRGKMLLADYFEFVGRESDAHELAREVHVKAKALDYVIPFTRAEDHLAGKKPLGASEAALLKTKEETILATAQITDEMIRIYAGQIVRLYDLELDRLPVVEREYISMRESARDRLEWCRHLDRRCDDRQTSSQRTMYKTEANQICICHLHKFESLIPERAWEIIFSSFKEKYCFSCSDREPLNSLIDGLPGSTSRRTNSCQTE